MVDQTTHERLRALENNYVQLSQEVSENTEITKKVQNDTKELLNGWNAAKGAFSVLEFMGKLAKVTLPVVIVIAIIKTNTIEFVAGILKAFK